MRKISRRGLIGFIVFLIVGIILIAVGTYYSNYGWSHYLLATASNWALVAMLGWLIIIIDLIGGIYLFVKSSNKE